MPSAERRDATTPGVASAMNGETDPRAPSARREPP